MSKDPSTKVGAVLVKDRKEQGTGFNGFPPGIADDDRLLHTSTKYPIIIHGEMNALLDAGLNAKGSTLYMYGLACAPCISCTIHLIRGGVKKIYVAGKPLPARWAENIELSVGVLAEVGIAVIPLDHTDLEW